jgi:hypothetical protein
LNVNYYYTSFQEEIQVFPAKTSPENAQKPLVHLCRQKKLTVTAGIVLNGGRSTDSGAGERSVFPGQGIPVRPAFETDADTSVGKRDAVAVAFFVHGHDRDLGVVFGVDLKSKLVSDFHLLSPVWVMLFD